MKTKVVRFIGFLILFATFFTYCERYVDVSYIDEEGTIAELKNLTIGTLTEIATGSIGTAGGTITVSETGSKIDGLQITVPENSFTSAQTITISVADITSHKLGNYFNPISPLININCPGGYADDLMSVTIPVNIPEGSIPIGFFLDAATGKLEGIPFDKIGTGSITLLTRHFMSGSDATGTTPRVKNGAAETLKGANIVISSLTESVLNMTPMISSGFKPGTDDWEFVNRGSYIAPGGHCAGQNMAAMWYWFEKRPAEGQLNRKFCANPAVWYDNARGYRFCSVIQQDLVWDGTVTKFFEKYIDKEQEYDLLKLQTIAGAMLLTGEPQGVGIYFQAGTYADGKPKYAGHDLICYQISVMDRKMYISDPNTPGTPQFIEFKNNKFEPYVAKLNGDESDLKFPFVTYYAKTAYIEWNKIGPRYEELLDGTIGTIGNNQFPAYTITVTNDEDKELKDGFVTGQDTLHFTVFCPAAEIFYTVDGKKVTGMIMVDESGKRIDSQDGIDANDVDLNSSSFVALKPGLNKIGCVILGWRRSAKFDNGSFKNKFIDFKWYSIQLIPLNITPDPLVGRMLTDYTLIARTQGFAPANAKYVWDFGDGTPEVTKVNDSTVVHKFKEDDEYDVMVTLYDNSTNKKLCEAHSTAEIKSDMLSELQSYSCVSFLLAADFKYSNGGPDTIRICNWRNWDGYELKWEGTKFSAEYIWYYDGLFLGVDSCVGRLTGEMSSDGLTVKSLSGRFYWQWESNERGLEVLSIAEIPLDKEWTQHDVQPQYVLKGSEVIGQVVDLSYQKSWRPYMSNEVKTTFLEDVSYLNIDKPPIIKVQFYK